MLPAISPRQRRSRTTSLLRSSLTLAVVLTLLVVADPGGKSGRIQAATPAPTIVLILTDDQRFDTLWAMPNVQSELVAQGITFSNAFVTNPLCCPSRTSILTGKYSHSTNVYTNSWPYGGFKKFDDSSTIATWLDGRGYQTSLIGKYLNGYSGLYIPPGWDHWYAFTGAGNGAAYYYYDLNDDGTGIHHGGAESDYSTDVLANEAESTILGASPTEPLFMMFTPYAPHLGAVPAPRDKGTFSGIQPYRPPSFNETDITDKPSWVKQLPPMDQTAQDENDLFRQHQYEALQAADDAVGRIVSALETTGRLSNSLIVFMSDNGIALGEHRYTNKKQPYEESIRVPLVIRDDALISAPRMEDRFVVNVDIAPTFAEAAGVGAPGVEGVSLMPLLAGTAPPMWRTDFLLEHHLGGTDIIPTYCGVRNAGYMYAQYDTGEEELYDLAADPYELSNVAGDPAYQSALTSIRARMMELCSPLPPGLAGADVSVTDSTFSPESSKVAPGRIVRWNFVGALRHAVIDTSGMGLFDSGPRDPGGTFTVTFVDAGSYAYADPLHPTMTGVVRVPVTALPATGTTSSSFTITWGAGTAPSGFVSDVQVRRPGTTRWRNWRVSQVSPSTIFVPDLGAGTYSFRARLRNLATGAASGWSAVTPIAVT